MKDNERLPSPSKSISLTKNHLDRLRLGRYDEYELHMLDHTTPQAIVVQRFLANIRKVVREGFGLYLWSKQSGTGKTMIASSLLKAAARKGYSGVMINTAEINTALFDKTAFDSQETLLERLQSVHLLVIDDLGKEFLGKSDFLRTTIENILRQRSQCKYGSTIITSNLSPVSRPTKPSDLEVHYGGAATSLISDMCYFVQVIGQDFRKTIRQDHMQELFDEERPIN